VSVRKADIFTVKFAQIIRPAIARVDLRCLEWMKLFDGPPKAKPANTHDQYPIQDLISSVTHNCMIDLLHPLSLVLTKRRTAFSEVRKTKPAGAGEHSNFTILQNRIDSAGRSD